MKFFLYPGAFKPFHDGHYTLLKRYIETYKNDDDSYFMIIVSSTPREFITIDKSIEFITNIVENKLGTKNVIVYPDANPMRACYTLVGQSILHAFNKDVYTIISSSKGNDNKRFEDFYNSYNEGGKYYSGINKIFKPNDIILEPVLLDDGTPINATTLRNYIKENDYDGFKSGYKHMLSDDIISENELKVYFNALKK